MDAGLAGADSELEPELDSVLEVEELELDSETGLAGAVP